MDAAIIPEGKACTNAVAQRRTAVVGKRHAISGGGCLAAEKWCPVILKVPEWRWGIDCSNFDRVESRILKKTCQRVRITQRKSPALIERDCVGIQGYCRVPKATHHLHFAGVIPYVCCDDTATTRHPFHFSDSFRRIGNEIYHQAGYRGVSGTVGDWNFLRIAEPEGRARVGHCMVGKSEKAG